MTTVSTFFSGLFQGSLLIYSFQGVCQAPGQQLDMIGFLPIELGSHIAVLRTTRGSFSAGEKAVIELLMWHNGGTKDALII